MRIRKEYRQHMTLAILNELMQTVDFSISYHTRVHLRLHRGPSLRRHEDLQGLCVPEYYILRVHHHTQVWTSSRS